MLLHACRVAKEQDEKERRQEWNREESCIVGITVLSHWWTPSKRSTVIGYRVTTSKRTNDGNQRIQTAVAQLLLPSSSFLVFSFFFFLFLFPCSLDLNRPFTIGVKIFIVWYDIWIGVKTKWKFVKINRHWASFRFFNRSFVKISNYFLLMFHYYEVMGKWAIFSCNFFSMQISLSVELVL